MEMSGWAEQLSPSQLDEGLPTPLYHQIYLVLREKIRAGAFGADTTLPGEQEMARLFNVSRITVKRALNELAADGLVSRHRGRGTIVTQGSTIPIVKGSFDTLIESLRIMGLETELELLDVADTPADRLVAQHLGLALGTLVQRAVRRRKLQGEPFSHLVTYVPVEIAKTYSKEDLASTAMLTLLERSGHGAYEAEQWITAVSADPAVAAALEVPPGAPLLKVERVMRGLKGEPVQLIYSHYRPDRFQYHVKTYRRRPPGSGAPATAWREEG
jgi:GntR family transcriptional regulator